MRGRKKTNTEGGEKKANSFLHSRLSSVDLEISIPAGNGIFFSLTRFLFVVCFGIGAAALSSFTVSVVVCGGFLNALCVLCSLLLIISFHASFLRLRSRDPSQDSFVRFSI